MEAPIGMKRYTYYGQVPQGAILELFHIINVTEPTPEMIASCYQQIIVPKMGIGAPRAKFVSEAELRELPAAEPIAGEPAPIIALPQNGGATPLDKPRRYPVT